MKPYPRVAALLLALLLALAAPAAERSRSL